MLIAGRKFGIRLWLLVTGADPFTAYVHNQGLVLFSTERCGLPLLLAAAAYCRARAAAVCWRRRRGRLAEQARSARDARAHMHAAETRAVCAALHVAVRCACSYDVDSLSDDEGAAGRGHITNYAQNVDGTVWSLAMLKQHLGERRGGGSVPPAAARC